MEYATLGNTGLLVSKLCFGTMTFGSGRGVFKAIGAVGQARADELVKTSIDGGINFFDTADNYTEGESEKILGQSLKNLNIARKDVVIATKVYSRVGPGQNDIGASRGHIMDGVEASLRRLQTDHIDLYQIHANDSVTPVEAILGLLVVSLSLLVVAGLQLRQFLLPPRGMRAELDGASPSVMTFLTTLHGAALSVARAMPAVGRALKMRGHVLDSVRENGAKLLELNDR